MLRFAIVFGVLVASFAGIEAGGGIEILKPIRDTGVEVALIFTTVSPESGDVYRKTAEAIQAASGLRIWIALNEHAYYAFAGRHLVPKAPEKSIKALKKAGMKSDNFVGVAHGKGGQYLHTAAKDSKLKAVILFGSTLPRNDQLQDYPLPILTLAAELDGVVRITRMAVEFEKLRESVKVTPDSMFRTPVVLLQGVNHAQFASETLQASTIRRDLTPDVTDDEAHRMIAKYVNSFLAVAFGSSSLKVDSAKADLKTAYTQSYEYFQPILEVRVLGFNGPGNGSLWTIQLQEHIADEFANQISVSNKAWEFSLFYDFAPYISTQNGKVSVTTIAREVYRTYDRNPDIYRYKESPYELDVKLKSKDAVWEALANVDNATYPRGPSKSLKEQPATCKSLNELAFQVALEHVSPGAAKRYETRGRPIVFEDDNKTGALFFWAIVGLVSDSQADGLHVKASAYITPINSGSNPGMMYCKLMSPYRVLEWIIIDSLREFPRVY